MIEAFFVRPPLLALLVIPLALATIGLLARRYRRRRLTAWGAGAFAHRRVALRSVSAGLFFTGLVFAIIGIAGPQWGRGEIPETAGGRDIVCVLDTSRSMLAEDQPGNRLERAKLGLEELSRVVEKRGGHRLALVTFASQAKLVCPLTPDYDHFRIALTNVDNFETVPGSKITGGIPASGTRIGAGILEAIEVDDRQRPEFRDILLISDGDDPAHDEEWQLGLQAARSAGIPVHVAGIGDPDTGYWIPDRNGKRLRFGGKVVLSRLDEDPLRRIAEGTGGSYLPIRLGRADFGKWFEEEIATKNVTSPSQDVLSLRRQHYPLFLAIALSLLGIQVVLQIGKRE